MKPITLTVRVLNPVTGYSETHTISAYCPICLKHRGRPHLEKTVSLLDGATLLVHEWHNKCGHQDAPETLMSEIGAQCERYGCCVGVSDLFYPYCGRTCLVSASVDLAAELHVASATIEPFAEMAQTVLDACLRAGGTSLTPKMKEDWEEANIRLRSALFSAQINLIEAAQISVAGLTLEASEVAKKAR